MIEVYPRKIGQGLPGNGDGFLLSKHPHRLVQILKLGVVGLLQLGAQRLCILTSCSDELFSFGLGRVGGVAEESCPLVIDLLVLMLEVGLFLQSLRLFLFGVLKLVRNALFPFVDGVENGLAKIRIIEITKQ